MNPVRFIDDRAFSGRVREVAVGLLMAFLAVALGAMLQARVAREAYAETIASPDAWCEARGLRHVPPRSRYGARLCVDGDGEALIPFATREGT